MYSSFSQEISNVWKNFYKGVCEIKCDLYKLRYEEGCKGFPAETVGIGLTNVSEDLLTP